MSETPGVYSAGPAPEQVPDVVGIGGSRGTAAGGRVDRASVRLAWGRAMKAAGVSRKSVAEVCGVTPAQVSSWITGRRKPSVGHLMQAAYFLQTTPADLLGWYGSVGDRVNGDVLRLAFEQCRTGVWGTGDADNIRAVRNLVLGLDVGGGIHVDRVECLRRVLVRVVEELEYLRTEDQFPLLRVDPPAEGSPFTYSRALTPDPQSNRRSDVLERQGW